LPYLDTAREDNVRLFENAGENIGFYSLDKDALVAGVTLRALTPSGTD
jgi:hypothetical protein